VTGAEQVPRAASAAEEERRTSYPELFFDLVFVFALTQVTGLLLNNL
jgi:low temperature requirement protein LtrA